MKNEKLKTKNYKPIAFIALLIILIFAWIGSYWLKYHKWPWVDFKEAVNRTYTEKTKEIAPKNELTKETKITKSEEEVKSDLFRQGTMNDLAGKIGKLSPVKPVLGGKWFIQRFWFADDRDVYIEYEDGHILRRILVQITGPEEKPEYKIIAYFEPGENDWILKTGNDTMAGKKLSLYEYNENKKEWVKKN